jgi:hypothetical protein
MELDPNVIGDAAAYKLLIGCVVPRPIAWVSPGKGLPGRSTPTRGFFGDCCASVASGPAIAATPPTMKGARRSHHSDVFFDSLLDCAAPLG